MAAVAQEDVLAALRVVLREVRQGFKALGAELAAVRAEVCAASAVAPDSDLDGERGDPEVRRDPKRWSGAPQAPCRMSECPPDYLDVLADLLDWKADHPREGKEQYVRFDRAAAARARGWAKRKRAQAIAEQDL